MDKQLLIEEVKKGFQSGKRREEIRKEQLQKGWNEQDIDFAIHHIQREALKVIPGVSQFFAWYEDPKTHEKLTTPKMTAILLAGCFGILILITVIFNFFFAPFSIQAAKRDQQREIDLPIMREAINNYYKKHSSYPSSLENLQPEELPAIPKDPASGKVYQYTQEDGGANFQLCIEFEAKSPQCIYASPIKFTPEILNPNK